MDKRLQVVRTVVLSVPYLAWQAWRFGYWESFGSGLIEAFLVQYLAGLCQGVDILWPRSSSVRPRQRLQQRLRRPGNQGTENIAAERIPGDTRAHPALPAHTRRHTRASPVLLAHTRHCLYTRRYLCIPAHTRPYLGRPRHTRRLSHIPGQTPAYSGIPGPTRAAALPRHPQ